MAALPHHVIVVGAGFAGLQVARALIEPAAEHNLRVTLVDRHNYHLFQPLLYQVATAQLSPEDIGHAVRHVLDSSAQVNFKMATVTGANLDRQVVFLESERYEEPIQEPYDTLVVAAGAVPADYGIPGIADYAFPLKSLQHAVAMRNHVLNLFEDAEREPAIIDDGAFTFVVAGGGPTGVEVAGALAELTDITLRGDHPTLDLDRVEIMLVEPTDALLNGFHPESQAETLRELQEMGVDVRLGVGIDAVAEDHVRLGDGSTVRTRTVIWAAGVKGSPIAEALGLEVGRGGRVEVDDHLRVPGHPDVMVIGDISAAKGEDGRVLPQVSPVAMQQGRYVAREIVRGLAGEAPGPPFSYTNKGIMATIGRNAAVAEMPNGMRLKGRAGWVAWLGVHLVYLVGWRNRATTFMNWAWNYLTKDRGTRLLFSETIKPRGADTFNEAVRARRDVLDEVGAD